MSSHRVFIEQSVRVGEIIELNPNAANYLSRVLRLKAGAEVVLFNGQSPMGQYQAVISQISGRHVNVRIESFQAIQNESPIAIHLLQGISKGDRMDYTIQKSVEMGVNRIYPVWMERTNVKLSDDKRLQKKIAHWQGVSDSACEQSGRVCRVVVEAPIKFEQIDAISARLNLMLDPYSEQSLKDLAHQHSETMNRPDSVNIVIGPEGGLAEQERVKAREIGYTGIRLGPRILRTETAGLAVISNLQYLWGDF